MTKNKRTRPHAVYERIATAAVKFGTFAITANRRMSDLAENCRDANEAAAAAMTIDHAGQDVHCLEEPTKSSGQAVGEAVEVLQMPASNTASSAPRMSSEFSFPILAPTQESKPIPLTARSTSRDVSGPASTSQPVCRPQVANINQAPVRREKDQWTRALYGFLSKWFPVALEKGHSQVDWLRLGRTQPNLNGLNGSPPSKNITLEEVRKHSSKEDAWMVLRGKVYNITPYLRFHPGGVDVLMKAAGRDGTALFNKFHPWVNGDALMEKCFVGWLAPDADK